MKRGREVGEKLWKIRDSEGVMKCWVARWGESSPEGLSSVRVADWGTGISLKRETLQIITYGHGDTGRDLIRGKLLVGTVTVRHCPPPTGVMSS